MLNNKCMAVFLLLEYRNLMPVGRWLHGDVEQSITSCLVYGMCFYQVSLTKISLVLSVSKSFNNFGSIFSNGRVRLTDMIQTDQEL